MTEEEFTRAYTMALDTVLDAMAEEPEIDVDKFYSMTVVLENLRYFSPVLYAALKKKSE